MRLPRDTTRCHGVGAKHHQLVSSNCGSKNPLYVAYCSIVRCKSTRWRTNDWHILLFFFQRMDDARKLPGIPRTKCFSLELPVSILGGKSSWCVSKTLGSCTSTWFFCFCQFQILGYSGISWCFMVFLHVSAVHQWKRRDTGSWWVTVRIQQANDPKDHWLVNPARSHLGWWESVQEPSCNCDCNSQKSSNSSSLLSLS